MCPASRTLSPSSNSWDVSWAVSTNALMLLKDSTTEKGYTVVTGCPVKKQFKKNSPTFNGRSHFISINCGVRDSHRRRQQLNPYPRVHAAALPCSDRFPACLQPAPRKHSYGSRFRNLTGSSCETKHWARKSLKHP